MGNLVLAGATSGSITLEPTAVAGSNTITLPDNTGTLLTTGSTGQVIPKAALPTGSVLQVVNATTSTETSSTTSTYVDTTLTATITPTSSSSKILVIVHQNGISKNGSNIAEDMKLKLLRGSTDITVLSLYSLYTGTTLSLYGQTLSTCYLDSPATTSATTYKTQFAAAENAGTVSVQKNGANSVSTITLMEIAA